MRGKRWGAFVVALALALQLFVCKHDRWSRAPQGDGVYSWIFARSLAFDHDVDLANDYALCGDPWHLGVDRGTGHLDSPFYVGPALFWVPVLDVARLVVPLPADAPPEVRGGCRGRLTAFTLYTTPVVGALALAFAYLFARRFASDGAAALATGLLGLAGPSFAVSSVFVGYSHAYATFAVAVVLWGSVRAHERGARPRDLVVPAVALAVAVLQRPPLALFAVVPLVVVLEKHRPDLRRIVASLAPVALGLSVGVGLQLALYDYLYGSPFIVPQGRYYVQIGHAHPWLTLFAPHGGLFYTAPAVWLAVFGLRPMWRRDGASGPYVGLVRAAWLAAAVELYLASAVLDWDASWTIGARRLTALTPLFVAAAAICLERVGRWLLARRERALAALGAALLVPLAFTSVGQVWGVVHGDLDAGVGLSQADAYGTSQRVMWGVVDARLGDLSVLPAEILFWARYGLPPNRFREASEPSWYDRDFRDLRVRHDTIPLTHARIDRQSRGLARTDDGVRLDRPEAHLVFAAEWPFATAYELHVRAHGPAHLAVGAGNWHGARWLVDADLQEGEQTVLAPLPEGTFDSGLDEIVLRGSGDVVVTGLRIRDDTTYPPAR